MLAGGNPLRNFDSIQTISLNASQATVSFTSIPQTYTHLQIRGFWRCADGSAGLDYSNMRFNADTASNYSYHNVNGWGATVAVTGSATQTSMLSGISQCDTSLASTFGVQVTDILDYTNTNKYKTMRSLAGTDRNSATYDAVYFASGNWRSTAAITSISLTSGTAGFTQYSHFALYGIK